MSDTADTPLDYLDALHTFYSERCKAGLKSFLSVRVVKIKNNLL